MSKCSSQEHPQGCGCHDRGAESGVGMSEPSFKLGPIQQKWLDALKSGKYTHCLGRLGGIRNGIQKNCCLGVLCDILAVHKYVNEGGSISYDGMEAFPPIGIVRDAGLKDDRGSCGAERSLSLINDNTTSYASVIEILETRPRDVFIEPK